MKNNLQNLSDEQRRKILAAAEIVDGGDMAVLKKIIEFDDTIGSATEKIDEFGNKIEVAINEVKTKIDDTITTAKQDIETIKQDVATKLSEVQDGKTPTEDELKSIILPLIPKVKDGKTPTKKELISLIEPLIPTPLDGKDANPEDVVPLVIKKLPSITPDNRQKIVEKINSGKKNDLKIQASQIEGLLLKSELDRAIGILDKRTQFLINKPTGTSGGSTSFIGLTDVPSTYAGSALKVLRVNAGETALEFTTLAGGGDALKADPLSQFASTTSAQLAGVISDETGSGALVFATSPTLVTPVLGVATATSINKVTITAPATGSTLTIDDGFTLRATGNVTALSGSHTGSSSGTNTGDQTSIVGITGTKAQFDTAVTDGNFLYVGDITQYTDEMAQDAVGAMVDATLTYNDATPLLSVASAPILTTARTIGGTSFNGSANIKIGALNSTNIDATTSAELAGVISDETGSGKLVFATSPTLTTSLITDSTTFALLNTTATTVNAFGDTTTLNIGASATMILNFGGGATASEFRFLEPSGSGTNYTAFKAQAQGASITYTLPATVGGAGTFLKDVAGDGVLSWATVSGSGDVSKVGTPVNNQMAVWTGDGTLEGTSDFTYDGTSLNLITGKNFQIAGATILADSTGTTTLSNIDALDATTEATIESAIDTLPNLTSIQGLSVTLADAGANAIFGWDDTAGAYENLTQGEARTVLGLATSDSPQFTAINLGHASDTTLTRVSAGVVAIEGVNIETTSTTANSKIASITFAIDGGGSAITTGIKGDVYVPYNCTINSVTMLADQSGSIVVDIWKDTYANYAPTVADTITASAKPTISSATKSQDTTLTGWTTSVSAGDTLRFNVDSITSITRLNLVLKVTKT